ncbi:TPA: hypothetical protein ACH3X1_002855 [Trebouxia sp. C0004]
MSTHHRSRDQQSGLPGSSHRRSEQEDSLRAGSEDHVRLHEALSHACKELTYVHATMCRTTETGVTMGDQEAETGQLRTLSDTAETGHPHAISLQTEGSTESKIEIHGKTPADSGMHFTLR